MNLAISGEYNNSAYKDWIGTPLLELWTPHFKPGTIRQPSNDRRTKEWVIFRCNNSWHCGHIHEKHRNGKSIWLTQYQITRYNPHNNTYNISDSSQEPLSIPLSSVYIIATAKDSEANWLITSPVPSVLVSEDIPLQLAQDIIYNSSSLQFSSIFINSSNDGDMWITKCFGDIPMETILKEATQQLTHLETLPKCRPSILISPRNSTINVYTDSLLIQEKDVTLQLHKVKGHSGDPGNDRADELAKEGLDHEFAFNNIFDHGNKDLSFMPSFQGTPIEQQLRKFLKTLMNFQTNSEWSQLKINNSAFTDRSQLYDWDVTWLVIKQVKHFKCTTRSHNSFWSFIIKLLHNQLP
ncbi:hypothetical protein GLOIN_2v1788498 [Rhizophagus clarus]|uniref:RNase H type-1 domain-containing protein n=1 Tax=Rhizophagus clarus TaxID=94130 RepID=A0A8H3LZS0_9GLOM|nr:hypothetical protein GLOIN_2v1788498 [Rhizophagus clarus]